MDCRHTRTTSRRWLQAGLGVRCLLWGGCLLHLGCVHQSIVPSPKDIRSADIKPADVPFVENKQEGKPKRQPRAATCVAFGDFRSQAAEEPMRTPEEREQMRDQARRAYQQALKIDPNCLEAYSGLGRLYQAMDDYDRALPTYQKALKAHPKEASLWFDCGMCQARHKEWPAAIHSLRTALHLDPENTAYAKTLGFCLGRAGRYDESFAVFKTSLGEGQAHYNLARMLHYAHEDVAATQHAALALQLQPNMARAKQLLAELEGGTVAAQADKSVAAGLSQAAASATQADPSIVQAQAPAQPGSGSVKEQQPGAAEVAVMQEQRALPTRVAKPAAVPGKRANRLAASRKSIAAAVGFEDLDDDDDDDSDDRQEAASSRSTDTAPSGAAATPRQPQANRQFLEAILDLAACP